MDFKAYTLLSVLFSCLMLVQSLALPMSPEDDQLQNQLLAAEKRPKYMETRDLSYFKDLMLMALDELIDEGKVNPNVLLAPPAGETQKRGERLTICIKMGANGSLVSRPCWKKNGRR